MVEGARSFSAVEACQRIAEEIWSGDRAHLGERVGGLNSEQAVRARLRVLAGPLAHAMDLVPEARAALDTIEFVKDDPLTVLERTEQMVAAQFSGGQATLDSVAEPKGETARRVGRLLVIQCVAGRLGRWAVRDAEIGDAKLARKLLKHFPQTGAKQRSSLVIAAEELYRMGQFEEAARCLLDADRAQRSPDVLFKAAVSYWKAENFRAALWCIRACLLEDIADFEGVDALLKAQMVESSLRAIVERSDEFSPKEMLKHLPEEITQSLSTTIDTMDRVAFGPRVDAAKLVDDLV